MSPSSNTFLLPTGGLSRCSFSAIHFWKLKAFSRPVCMTISNLTVVMRGLVPRISLREALCQPKRDGPDKPGHDGVNQAQEGFVAVALMGGKQFGRRQMILQ